MKTKLKVQQGFTLIELLVVIAIIAILASVSVPALQNAQISSKRSKSMQEARGIGNALKMYANDNDQNFPSGDDANEAFAQLFPEFGKEDPFYVSGSAWHGTGRKKGGPDNLWGDVDDSGDGGGGEALEAGENHWAYNKLLADDTEPTLPMIADGFSNAVGTYTDDKSAVGGVWRGKKAIIVFADYSGKVVTLDKQSFKYINKKANDRDEFARNGCEMVNPKKPSG